jgi:hypothetical protein
VGGTSGLGGPAWATCVSDTIAAAATTPASSRRLNPMHHLIQLPPNGRFQPERLAGASRDIQTPPATEAQPRTSSARCLTCSEALPVIPRHRRSERCAASLQLTADTRCLGVDLVAVEGDGVVWLDPPRLKARVAHQRPGQGVGPGDQGAAQVDLGTNAPGLVLGPE